MPLKEEDVRVEEWGGGVGRGVALGSPSDTHLSLLPQAELDQIGLADHDSLEVGIEHKGSRERCGEVVRNPHL
jgi:hypothetical protein